MSDITVTFDREPRTYRHWAITFDGPIATLTMQVDSAGGLRSDYELKLNSYDLGVDIELYDAVQRLRFEHPEVAAVVVTGGVDKVFCAGANIQMLSTSTHGHKVNFCKFTNETRNSIEDATVNSGQVYIAAVNGTAAGGGYELALACDEIILIDDRSSSVSLPEVPLLAVLPGTGGLTRVVDKRFVRRDLADVFSTRTEGVKGAQAVEWGLVDAVALRSRFDEMVRDRAVARTATSSRPESGDGVTMTPLSCEVAADSLTYDHVSVVVDRALGTAHITIQGPTSPQASTGSELVTAGADGWLLAAARQFDDAMLRLRFNEPAIGTWVLHTRGAGDAVGRAEAVLTGPDHWLANEIRLYWARTLKRLDVSARTIVTLVEPGSCFVGLLAELLLAADRSFMLDGTFEDSTADAPAIRLTDLNNGPLPMPSGISRLAGRFWGRADHLAAAVATIGDDLDAAAAHEARLVTFIPDDIDWDDEVRVALEERNSFSPDALTGMEASLRFAGPETMETKIFGRLTAWQNWIFQRPNAVGTEGALKRFGTGSRPNYDRSRV